MAWDHELSRHERGYDYRWTKRREHVMRRDMHLCQPCYRKGRPTPATQVDHIIPKSQDGTDDMDNLQAICDNCHKAKTAQEATGGKDKLAFDEKGFPIW
jgi:5-methylcytosine-specific restriction protein A